jgi:ComEC/Rec2-related protein
VTPPADNGAQTVRRHPLVAIAVCFIAGTTMGLHIPVAPALPVLCLAAFTIAALAIRRAGGRWSAMASCCCLAAVLLAAWAATGLRQTAPVARPPFTQRVHREHPGGPRASAASPTPVKSATRVDLRGIVCGEPIVVSTNRASYILTFPLRALAVDGVPLERRGRGRVSVRLYGAGSARLPDYGEEWQLSGRWRDSRGVLEVSRRNARWVADGRGSRLAGACLSARRVAAERLSRGIESFPGTVSLLHALLLGYRSQLSGSARDAFAATGTLHIFAISGLHVGIICGMIIFVLKVFRISRMYWVLFLAPLIAGYTFATGARPSAVRACVMAVVYYAAPLVGRRTDPLSALAAAALLVLAWRPTQLQDAGFVFSFVVVAGILAFYPPFERRLRPFWQPDPLRLQAEPKPIVLARQVWRYVLNLGALGCAAWLASAPLAALYFGRFAPIAMVGNLVVIPLAFFILVSGALSLVLGSCASFFAVIFNHTNVALVWLLTRAINALAAIPFGTLRIPRPPLWAVLTWYAILLVCAAWLRRGSGEQRAENEI